MNRPSLPHRSFLRALFPAAALVLFALLGIGGCADADRDAQLQKVAKDWSATIRASQVLPVYPLTEDLYPGDIFLVTMPVEEQQQLYKANGYLPLDQPVGRLTDLDFNAAYWNYYGTGNTALIAGENPANIPPAVRWSFGPNGQRLIPRPLPPGDLNTSNVTIANLTIGNLSSVSANTTGNLTVANLTISNVTFTNATTNYITNITTPSGNTSTPANATFDHWDQAPRTAFPSYSFSVDNQGSFNLALPIQGVPVGLSLLPHGQANGTVELSDATTYGIPLQAIIDSLRHWRDDATAIQIAREFPSGGPADKVLIPQFVATANNNKIAVTDYASGYGKAQYFIRVISRVYLIRSVNISLQAADSLRGAAQAGLNITANGTSAADIGNLSANLNTLNALMKTSVPNAELHFTALSNHTVGLNEKFDHPLVIGFLAYDFPINELGIVTLRPVATFAQLNGQSIPPPPAGHQTPDESEMSALGKLVMLSGQESAICSEAAVNLHIVEKYQERLQKAPKPLPMVALLQVMQGKYGTTQLGMD